jgi:hypothetical protein
MQLIPMAFVAILGACDGATIVHGGADTAAPLTEEVEVGSDTGEFGSSAPEPDDESDESDEDSDESNTDTGASSVDSAYTPEDVDGDGYAVENANRETVDCDDTNAEINPGEIDGSCDGVDQDCDGVDGNDISTAVDGNACGGVDEDGDGVLTPIDCNDRDASVYPGADEVADDGIDQDCDGSDTTSEPADTGDTGGSDTGDTGGMDTGDTGHTGDMPADIDADGDGVLADMDCDDTNASVYPGADETPYDGIDSDCDDVDPVDVDCDGYAAEVTGGEDCDDTDAAVNPGATETCDLIDNDCDEQVDEGVCVPDDLGEGLSWLRVDGASVGLLLSTDIFASSVSGDEVCVTGSGINGAWDCDEGHDMVDYDVSTGFMWYLFPDSTSETRYRVTWYSEVESEWAQFAEECGNASTDSALCYANQGAQGEGYSLCFEVVDNFVYALDDIFCVGM